MRGGRDHRLCLTFSHNADTRYSVREAALSRAITATTPQARPRPTIAAINARTLLTLDARPRHITLIESPLRQPGKDMAFEDRDWYRNEYKQKTARKPNLLQSVVDQTEKRRRTPLFVIALIWIAVVVGLYYAFTLAGH